MRRSILALALSVVLADAGFAPADDAAGRFLGVVPPAPPGRFLGVVPPAPPGRFLAVVPPAPPGKFLGEPAAEMKPSEPLVMPAPKLVPAEKK